MKVTSTTHVPAHAHIQFTDIGLEDLRLATDILPVLGEPLPTWPGPRTGTADMGAARDACT
jgi:hypothetical protein